MKRYEELVSLLIDGEPTEEELHELEQILATHPEFAEDLRQQLVIWERWSQEIAPERSADSFVAAFRTRLKAEEDANRFSKSAMKRLKPRKLPFTLAPVLAIAAAVVLMCVLYLLKIDEAANPNYVVLDAQAHLVSIKGECVCTSCTLNLEGGHNKAIRFADAKGDVQLIMVKRDPQLRPHTKHFCGGPTPVLVEGNVIEQEGEESSPPSGLIQSRLLAVTAIDIKADGAENL